MKIVLTLSILLVFLVCALGQTNDKINLIQADSSWGKEIIQVPFWFAPQINYQGYEDIRFADGWENIESDGFWTLVFTWDINLENKPKSRFFEKNLKLYFDGLMKVVNEDTKIAIPESKIVLRKTKNTIPSYTGTIETYDAFTTKKMILLNVVIEVHFCASKNQYIPFFKISPRDFDHKSWEMIHHTTLRDNICRD